MCTAGGKGLSGKAFREAPKAESKPAAGGKFWGFRAHEDSNPFTENAFHDGKSLENPKKFPPAAGYTLVATTIALPVMENG